MNRKRLNYLFGSLSFTALFIFILLNALNPHTLAASGKTAVSASITVNTTNDELNSDGDCSLREAVQSANTDSSVDACTAGNGADVITLPAGKYILSLTGSGEDLNATGDLDVLESLTINGASSNSTSINGFSSDRIFHINPALSSDLSFRLEDVQITNGDVGNGAGIYLSNSTGRLLDVDINSNTAITNGGGIYNNNSLLIIEGNSEIATNTAVDGAGIFSDGEGQLHIEDSWIHHNLASDEGGAAKLDSGGVTVRNSTIEYNEATEYGGGVYTTMDVLIEDSTIQHNTAVNNYGGGFYVEDGSLIIENSTVYSNTASYGGGVYLYGVEVYVRQSIFRDNLATSDGGGIYHEYYGGTIVEDSLFEENTANGSGGGISVYGYAGLAIDRSTFISNTATTDGGAIHTSGDDYLYTYIRNSTLTQNEAGRNGGAVFSYFLGVVFENSTVVANTAGNQGGGFANDSYFGYFYNTILAGNSANGSESDTYADCYVPGYNLHSAGNNLFGKSTGCQEYRYDFTLPVGTLFTNVLEPLADNGGATLPDDTHPKSYVLKSSSPAIDAGNDDFCPSDDQTGATRTNGNACDLGAVESDDNATIPTFTENVITVDTTDDDMVVNGNCTLREAVEAAETDTAVDNCDAGDGWDVVQLSTGTYMITPNIQITTEHVTIRGASTAGTIIHGNDVSQLFYEEDDGGLILQDLTISHGLDSSDGGCLEAGGYGFVILVDVVVSDCEGQSGGAIEVYGHLNLVRSTIKNNTATQTGGGVFNYYGLVLVKDSTIINNTANEDGGGFRSEYGLSRLSNTGIMSNTITNTASTEGAGVYIEYALMILDDESTVQYNQSANDCGGIYSYYAATLIENATISHNTSANNGGGICGATEGVWLLNSLVENNVASGDGGGFYGGGLIENSTIRYNEANSGSGGGVYVGGEAAVLETSSIYGNSAGYGGGVVVDGSSSLSQVTVSENTAVTSTGGISMTANSILTIKSSIVANSTGSDCAAAGELLDGGYNLVESGACITDSSSLSGDPMLTPMTEVPSGEVVLPLLVGSSAVDIIPIGVNGCGDKFVLDQRGYTRPADADADGTNACDIGAFEFNRTFIYLTLIAK
ncbi:MAG: CSLREA domain-containing protein [Chloroflexi bacterium]|nr:MAG: CSLREA domain-containing protein [Chloroflexota bacterium]